MELQRLCEAVEAMPLVIGLGLIWYAAGLAALVMGRRR